MKMITHGQKREVKGAEFDRYWISADDFVRRMKKVIDER